MRQLLYVVDIIISRVTEAGKTTPKGFITDNLFHTAHHKSRPRSDVMVPCLLTLISLLLHLVLVSPVEEGPPQDLETALSSLSV